MNTAVQEVVNQIADLFKPQYIYAGNMPVGEEDKTLLLVVTEDKATGTPDDRAPVTGKVLEAHTGFLFRLYPQSYVIQQLWEGNLFFLRACVPDNLAYSRPGQHIAAPANGMDMAQALAASRKRFSAELDKVRAFREGAAFFTEKEDYPQAAFMWHQAVELAYRLAELLVMGKEKICHSIAGHQKYIQEFSPELATLFNPEDEKESALLQLLDQAYKGVRYGKDYRVTKTQLDVMADKAETLQERVQQLFNTQVKALKSTMDRTSCPRVIGQKEEQEIKGKIKKLVADKFYKYRPDSEKIFYKTNFMLDSPLDVLFGVSSLIKVCVMALKHSHDGYSPIVPEPYVNIRMALEFALQLLPYDEIECLEEIMRAYEEQAIPVV